MSDFDTDIAIGEVCFTSAKDDRVLIALFVYNPWVSKLGSRRSICVDHMPRLAPHHLQDGYNQEQRDP